MIKTAKSWPFLLVAAQCLGVTGLALDGPPAPLFRVETAAEARNGCILKSLDEEGVLRVEQASTPLTLPHLVELQQEGRTLPPLLTRDFVLFSNGDRLPIDANAAATLEENRLLVWPAKSLPEAHAQRMSLFLPYVVLLFWSLPQGVDDADLFFARLAAAPRPHDEVYLQNGDRIEGAITALGPQSGCVVTTDRRRVHITWSRLAGIAWSSERQARLRTRKTYYHAVHEGGARISYAQLRFEEKSQRWIGKTQFGPGLEFSRAHLLALVVRQSEMVELSDLIPVSSVQPSYLGISWPLMKNTSAAGHPLRLRENTYETGLGTHAPCRVSYPLKGQYRRFMSLVGMDPLLPRGRARVAVELDGKRTELHDGKEITVQDPPLRVRLDVQEVHEMTLITDVGSFGDVQAHVNWAHARLIKKNP